MNLLFGESDYDEKLCDLLVGPRAPDGRRRGLVVHITPDDDEPTWHGEPFDMYLMDWDREGPWGFIRLTGCAFSEVDGEHFDEPLEILFEHIDTLEVY